MQIAFLGLGKMGIPMARWLQKSGHPLTVWNRSGVKDSLGASVADSVVDAVQGKEIVFTSLSDDSATQAVSAELFEAMAPGAIHGCLSTISVALSRRLTESHQQKGQRFVGAPVFGRPPVAEEGKLWIVLGGESQAVETVRPILNTFSRGITVVSDQPWRAHALKLGGNFMIAAMIQAISEATIFAQALGLDGDVFTETVNNALFQSPFYGTYSKIMLHPPETPRATVAIGVKDVGLFREAAEEAGRRLPLGDYIADQLHRAQEAGLAEEEWSVGQYRIAEARSLLGEASDSRLDVG